MGEALAMVVSTRTKPGQRDAVQQQFEADLGPRAMANDAQAVVVWSADDEDPDVFHLFEIYRDRAAADEAAEAPWFWDYLAKVGPLLDGQPTMRRMTPRWTKGVDIL